MTAYVRVCACVCVAVGVSSLYMFTRTADNNLLKFNALFTADWLNAWMGLTGCFPQGGDSVEGERILSHLLRLPGHCKVSMLNDSLTSLNKVCSLATCAHTHTHTHQHQAWRFNGVEVIYTIRSLHPFKYSWDCSQWHDQNRVLAHLKALPQFQSIVFY